MSVDENKWKMATKCVYNHKINWNEPTAVNIKLFVIKENKIMKNILKGVH